MENFLRDPMPEEASKLISSFYSQRSLCVRGPYDTDYAIFAGLLTKYFKGEIGVSFNSQCRIGLEKREIGNFLVVEDKEIYIGNTSFTSLLPLTVEDLVPILAGISSDSILYRRKLSDWEVNLLRKAENLGVTWEKSLKIPGYKDVPLFLSLTYSLDPFVPEISGNRENSLKLVRELGGNEFTKLEELDEGQLNTLIFKLISLIVKINPKVSRDDLLVDRYYFLSYDFLELGLVSLYTLDRLGYPGLLDLTLDPSLFITAVQGYREALAKGFTYDVREEKGRYVVDTQLQSPLLVYVALRQLGKVKGNKPVVVSDGGKIITSRFFGKQDTS
ncbi:hypothetical protein [Metallosphaera hakonensis]|uniref:Single-stranded DNA exonuclease n=1 Tax=Metallosphaera hakonensis JCM 8857 = DSM 7519 TaxID=1293036 RepID=A0A2U9IUX4_9CREN|nr:hypothetical protein [Metallosphaera hakonensis]AWR99828.1 hypothetical protein DFR87_09125 [Metallosphaera hakonensis JCM 8857 = DSM 7519]